MVALGSLYTRQLIKGWFVQSAVASVKASRRPRMPRDAEMWRKSFAVVYNWNVPRVGVGVCSSAAVVSPALFFSRKQGGLFASAAAAACWCSRSACLGSVSLRSRTFFGDGDTQDGSALSGRGRHGTGCVICIIQYFNKLKTKRDQC